MGKARAAARPPRAPTRVQEGRVAKKTEFSKQDIDGANPEEPRRGGRKQYFDTSEAARKRVAAMAEIEKARRAMLRGCAAVNDKTCYNGDHSPHIISFGPNGGAGAGFIDGRWFPDTFHFGWEQALWLLAEEEAPERAAKASRAHLTP